MHNLILNAPAFQLFETSASMSLSVQVHVCNQNGVANVTKFRTTEIHPNDLKLSVKIPPTMKMRDADYMMGSLSVVTAVLEKR